MKQQKTFTLSIRPITKDNWKRKCQGKTKTIKLLSQAISYLYKIRQFYDNCILFAWPLLYKIYDLIKGHRSSWSRTIRYTPKGKTTTKPKVYYNNNSNNKNWLVLFPGFLSRRFIEENNRRELVKLFNMVVIYCILQLANQEYPSKSSLSLFII